MQRNVMGTALILLSGVLLAVLIVPVKAQTDEIQPVRVTNFPDLQRIAGTVSVEGPVRHASFQRIHEIVVPPIEPTRTGQLIDGGIVTVDGFTAAVLSLRGQVQGRTGRSGAVGAILIPEEEEVVRVFEEEGQAQFPLEVSATLASGSSRSFASTPTRVMTAFPRYRVRLYNSSDRTVKASLYLYLTH